MSTTALQRIIDANWSATEQQVEALAHDRYNSDTITQQSDGTYLRIVLVAAQAQLPKRTRGRPSKKAQLTALGQIHERLYAAVLRGVTTPDIAPDANLEPAELKRRSLERNSRSAFARTSYSTLTGYVSHGGDLRTLDAPHVSKASLRATWAPAEAEDKTERQIQRAEGSLMRALTRQAKVNPAASHDAIEAFMEQLQTMLEGLEETPKAPKRRATDRKSALVRGPGRPKAGAPPVMHRSA